MIPAFREHLSAPGLVRTLRGAFDKVKDWRKPSPRIDFSVADSLLAGVAIFAMKYPSLLRFNGDRGDDLVSANLRNLYGLDAVPSDTRMREILDPVSPDSLRPAFKAVFARLQDGKELLPFRFIDDSYLISIDGTGFFSSHEVHCDNCCEKISKDGISTYYHQMLAAVLVHPSQKQVIPLAPEAILKQDGESKNDCEVNAAKRLLPAIRRDHPHLKITILGDGLFANGPMVKLTRSLDMGFIFTAKPGDHHALFDYIDDARSLGAVGVVETIDNQIERHFEFLNEVPLNASHPDTLVNVLLYRERRDGKETKWSWITSIFLTDEIVNDMMRGGRARWKIENETFNTLKNQGYQFEHNFGHGNKNLSTVFAYLMLLAFLCDQAQELSCPVFRRLAVAAKQRVRLWERIRSYFLMILTDDWEGMYSTLIRRFEGRTRANTS